MMDIWLHSGLTEDCFSLASWIGSAMIDLQKIQRHRKAVLNAPEHCTLSAPSEKSTRGSEASSNQQMTSKCGQMVTTSENLGFSLGFKFFKIKLGKKSEHLKKKEKDDRTLKKD